MVAGAGADIFVRLVYLHSSPVGGGFYGGLVHREVGAVMGISLREISEIGKQISTAYQNKDAARLADIDTGLSAMEAAARKLHKNTGLLRAIQIQRAWALVSLGEVLNETCPHGGARYPDGNLKTLQDYGISPKLSAKARKLAEIDPQDIETFINESGDEINMSYLLRLHTESVTEPPGWDEEREWKTVLAVLSDYYASGTDEDRLALVAGILEAK